jgi:hypothetical protein
MHKPALLFRSCIDASRQPPRKSHSLKFRDLNSPSFFDRLDAYENECAIQIASAQAKHLWLFKDRRPGDNAEQRATFQFGDGFKLTDQQRGRCPIV